MNKSETIQIIQSYWPLVIIKFSGPFVEDRDANFFSSQFKKIVQKAVETNEKITFLFDIMNVTDISFSVLLKCSLELSDFPNFLDIIKASAILTSSNILKKMFNNLLTFLPSIKPTYVDTNMSNILTWLIIICSIDDS